jgi:hypothetical protein
VPVSTVATPFQGLDQLAEQHAGGAQGGVEDGGCRPHPGSVEGMVEGKSVAPVPMS